MGDGYYCAGILLQVLLEPVDGLGVEVVGRLVEQKHVGLLEQKAAEGHASALASGKGLHRLVVGRALEGVHGALQAGIYVPGVGGVEGVLKLALALDEGIHLVGVLKHVGVGEGGVHLVELTEQVHYRLYAFAYNLYYGFGWVELRLLLKIAYRVAGREYHFPLVILVDSGDNFQKR